MSNSRDILYVHTLCGKKLKEIILNFDCFIKFHYFCKYNNSFLQDY